MDEVSYITPMKRFPSAVILVVMAGYLLSSCGTTHHYLPSRPLAKDEWTLSVNWHYDFDGRKSSLIIPEATTYVGVGNDINLGFGMQAPFFMSHFSFGKYYEAKKEDYWTGYFHLNQFVFGSNNNPLFETGCQYSDYQNNFAQNLSIGLAYGCGVTGASVIPLLAVPEARLRFRKTARLMPVIKYQLAGSDLGVSYAHYHGLFRSFVNLTELQALIENDTLMIINNEDVDSIKQIDPPMHVGTGSIEIDLIVFLKNNTQVNIGRYNYPDDVSSRRTLYLGLHEANILYTGTETGISAQIPTFWISKEYLTEEWKAGRDIVIATYPMRKIAEAKRRSLFVDNHSVSVSWFPKIEK